MSVPELETPRLRLRGWRPEDREPFARLNADGEVMRHFTGVLDRAASDVLADRIEEHFRARGFGLWAVEPREGPAFVGFVGLCVPSFEAHFMPAVEIGWRLARGAWGKGFATEAARAALRFGFEELGLGEIVSMTVPGNARSRAVMERLGMTRAEEDDFDHPRVPEGHALRRHVLYRVARGWRAG